MAEPAEIEVLRGLVAICDAFEAAWSANARPDFPHWLDRVKAEHREQLLALLVERDVGLQRRAGRTIQIDDYRSLGPVAEAVVHRQIAQESPTFAPSPNHESTTLAPATTSSAGSPLIGPYKLLQQIGEGGMGEVWMAEQEKPVRRRVALKLIKAGADNKQIVARFEAERQALAMMDHQNIAKVLDAGTTESGQPYFVMELVHGIPLTKYCDQNKLSINERLELFIAVCYAVQHAHQKGIIHRDIKPSNVLVALHDGKPVPKIIDFGLAKALQHQTKLTDKTLFTEFGQVVGTLQYMSPEQAEMNQLDIDTRSDIYSLGVILYELLTGSTPLEKKTIEQQAILKILKTIREQDPPRPSVRLSSTTNEAVSGISQQRRIEPTKLKHILRGDLDWIVMKALEKDRTRRYETATGFSRDLERYLSDEVVTARPPSTTYRVGKFVRKHKGLVASLSSIAVLLIAGIIGTSFFAFAANKARARSDAKTIELRKEKANVERERDRANANETLAKSEAERAQSALDQTESTLARSNYFLAVARWEANRAREARELLDLVPSKYRRFEWHLARSQFQGGYMTCYGNQGFVVSVAFSPDGARIVSGSHDNTLKLWDAATGQELRTLRGHTGPVRDVRFSPDGAQIVSGSDDNMVKLWDAVTGQELRTLQGHTQLVSSVCFSPDGRQILSGSDDQTLRLWDAATGQELHALQGHTNGVSSVAFSPDGSRIVSGSGDTSLKLWDAATGQELRTLEGHTQLVSSVCFSPDGARIVSGSWDNTLKLWDAATGQELRTLRGHAQSVGEACFSPDGTWIASGSWDNTLKLWDAVTGQELRTFQGHSEGVASVSFSPDGTRIVSGSWDKTLKLWDTTTGQELHMFRGHSQEIVCVSFRPDGTQLASGSQDNTIKLWDAATGQEIKTLPGHLLGVSCVSFSPDGTRIVSGSDDKTLKLWDAASGKELRTFEGHTREISSVSFSPDGARIVSGSWDNTLKMWDVVTGKALCTFEGHSEEISSVSFSPDGKRIVSGSWDNTLKLWDASNGQELSTLQGHTDRVSSVSFSPDGARIVSGSWDNTLKLWNASNGQELRTLRGHTDLVHNAIFSPDGARIVSGSWDNTLKVWDADSGQELRTLQGHSSHVYGISFSPDGARLVSASGDKTLIRWDAVTQGELRRLRGHTEEVSNVSFSSDDRRIYSRGANGEQIVWDAQSGVRLDKECWQELGDPKTSSNDGRWMVAASGDEVLVVDREYKNQPFEKGLRSSKAQLRPQWHREQASTAESGKDWHAALFHRAWIKKADPEQAESWDQLHAAHQQWLNERKSSPNPTSADSSSGGKAADNTPDHDVAAQQKIDPDILLAPTVRQMLALPRGKKLPPLTESTAREINNAAWNIVKQPAPDEANALTAVQLADLRRVVEQFPRGTYFNTLGTAEYRMGNYQAAIDACNKSLELLPNEQNLPGPHPSDLAILAMSQQQLGHTDEAKKLREQFSEAIKHEKFKDDPECQSFANEMSGLFNQESDK